MRRVALAVLVAMVTGVGAMACGGGDGSDEASAPVPSEPTALDADQPLGVEFLGDLAIADSQPVTATFDSAPGSLPLADGAVLEVPPGAFQAPTEVTVEVADLAFERFVENGPEGAVYAVSTAEAVELVVPVVLEVPVPASSARVVQRLDGEWRVVDVVPGPSTRVPIPHFTEVVTIVTEPAGEVTMPEGEPPADGDAPGDFLTACLFSVTLLLAEDADETGSQDVSLALPLAYSFCARALVTKFSPSGVRVEVSCVGDAIGGEVDFRAAMDICIAEATAPDTDPVESSDPERTDEAPDPPGDRVFDGHYQGEVDIVSFYEGVNAQVAEVLTVSENIVVADAVDGRLMSLTGAVQTYNPEIVLDDGGICENDGRLWFEADAGSATSTGDGFEATVQWSSHERTGDCGGFSPTEETETGSATAAGRLDPETGALVLEIEVIPGVFLSGLLTEVGEGAQAPSPAPNSVVTTTTTTLPAPGFQFTASEFDVSAGRFQGQRGADWSGTYATQDGTIVGSATMTGFIEGACQDSSDGPFGPVSITLGGSYRITGTVSEGVAQIRLDPDPGTVDLIAGDTSKECVQTLLRLGETMTQLSIGHRGPGGLPLDIPAEGGSTTLEYPSGKVIEVTVSALG